MTDRLIVTKTEYGTISVGKQWVGLTDAEVEKVFFDMGQFAKIDLKTFARAIEAKLKEKNT